MKRTLLLITAFAAFAQTPKNPPETVIRINVNLVQLDAVVHDSKGQPVTNLTKDDFEILQDGKPQTITNFSFISTPLEPGAAAAPAPTPRPANTKGVPAPPPITLKPNQVRRTVALVIDDLGLSFESVARLRGTLKKFVDQQMQPGDLVAIVRTGAGMGALQQFTSDRRLLYAAIDRVRFNGLGRIGISSFAPLNGGDETGNPEFDDARNQIFSVGTLGAVRFVVNGLRELPGRKSLILFSENLRLFYEDQGAKIADSRTVEAIRHLVDAANRSSVVIYSVDPRGLQYHGLNASDNTSRYNPTTGEMESMSATDVARLASQRSEEVLNSQDGLVMLAQDTGGLFLANSNDLDGQLRKALDDSSGYYLIGYHPSASTFDEKTGEPKFHKVRIRMKTAGLHVRTRVGFFGTSDRLSAPVAHSRWAQIAQALSSPFSSGQIHVRLTTLFSNAAKMGSYVNAMLYIDAKDLKFEDMPDGWHKAVIDVVAVTFGDNGQPVDTSDRTFTVRARAEVYKEMLDKGLIYSVHHPVKKAGAYQMRTVVRDAGAEQVGSASQFVEVPDVAKGRLTLSSLVLQGDRTQQPDAAAAPIGEEGQSETSLASPAVRIFKPGASMLYGFQVLNADTNAEQKTDLELQTRLFRDGQEIYAGKPMPLPMNGQSDPKRLIGGGLMRLGEKMKPGDYVLQVIVRDKLAKEKFQVAAQSMDFEIQ